MIVKDSAGNELLAVIDVSEELAEQQYSTVTHALLVVKIGEEYLLGWNRWRQDWEIFGGCKEEGETLSPSERETFSKWHNVSSINTESISNGLKFWSTFENKSQRNWNRTEFYLQEQPCPSCSSFWQRV